MRGATYVYIFLAPRLCLGFESPGVYAKNMENANGEKRAAHQHPAYHMRALRTSAASYTRTRAHALISYMHM